MEGIRKDVQDRCVEILFDRLVIDAYWGGRQRHGRFRERKSISLILTKKIKLQKRMFRAVGDKDMNYRQLKNVRRRYPHMNVIVQKGHGHCAYMAEHYREYGALLEQYMEQSQGKQGN